jgi:hypothetical protein
MKPETERYLAKARQMLTEARTVAGVELAEAAGRWQKPWPRSRAPSISSIASPYL